MSAAGFFALACSTSAASVLTYNPGLGTMPQAQGWTFSGSYNAPSVVSGGQLTYGPTSVNGTTYWEHEPVDPISFVTQTIFIEATIRLSGSDHGNFSGYRRAGFSLMLQDDTGRWIIADVGDSRVSVGNDDFRTSDPVANLDMTSAFRTVRLEAGPAGGRLLVDGNLVLSLALGTGRAGTAQGWWGDGTILANANQTEVRNVTFIPAPSALALAGIAAMGIRRQRRTA